MRKNRKLRKQRHIRAPLKPKEKHYRSKIDESTQEKSQHESFMLKKKCEGKFFEERAQNVLFWCISAFARNMPKYIPSKTKLCIHDHFEKGKSFFLHYFLMEYSWEPCSMFSMECAFSPKVLVEPSMCTISFVSCVVQWKANIFYFSHSFILLFREYHSRFPCCV